MRELIVVRHGEAEGNVQGIAQGRRPYPLTEQGRRQAEAAASLVLRLGWRPDRLVTSPVRRCVETAEILARRLDLPPAVPDEAFAEIDSGRGTGRPLTELAEDFAGRPPSEWAGFEAFGGESTRALLERVARGADALPAEESVLLVTHGAVFKALLAHLLRFPTDFFLDLRCGTCLRLARKRIGGTAVLSLTHLLHAGEIADSLSVR